MQLPFETPSTSSIPDMAAVSSETSEEVESSGVFLRSIANEVEDRNNRDDSNSSSGSTDSAAIRNSNSVSQLPRPPRRVDMERTPPSSATASPVPRDRKTVSTQSTSTAPPQPPLVEESANAMSVGLMAQGLHWVRRQRDRRQRIYLQNQAEQQLLKIRQAQQAERDAAAANNRSLLDNTTFLSFMSSMTPTTSITSNTTSVTSTVKPSSQEEEDEEGGQGCEVAAAAVSRSGIGFSVELAVEDNSEDDASYIPPVRVDSESDLEMNPFILSQDQMQQMAIHVLPRGIAYCRWKRLYSLARDGDSFDACLRQLAGHPKTLMVIRTSRNAVFGGFADEAWEPHMQGGTSYFGGPTACLFSIPSSSTDAAAGSKENTTILTYKWTGANRYVQLCDLSHKMLAFGGGGDDGAFGLCVEQDFQVGSTGPCATFGNDPLCEQENFKIVDMEVFGFLVGQF